jgi:hypothetical protein
MQTVEIERLGGEIHALVAAAQTDDVFITEHGRIVAVLSKPKLALDDDYGRQREALLAQVVVASDWDSTVAVSEDRDRY